MSRFGKIAAKLQEYDLDAMLLTGEANRFYGSGFFSTGTDGVALVTRDKSYFITDSRYIEAAGRKITDAELCLTGHGRGYTVQLAEMVRRHHIRRLGFEEAYMSVLEWETYR